MAKLSFGELCLTFTPGWYQLANTIERSVHDGDAALCGFSLTFFLELFKQRSEMYALMAVSERCR